MIISITPAAIASACRTAVAAAVTIEVVAQTGSTNADLMARVGNAGADGAQPTLQSSLQSSPPSALTHPTLLVALEQTAGRGRAGRIWQSNSGSLTFSLAWPSSLPVSDLLGLPLAIGVAVAEVLAARRVAVALKWPNDILFDGRKLAGILIETSGGVGSGAIGGTGTVVGINASPARSTATDSTTSMTGANDRIRRRTWAVIGIGLNLLSAGSDDMFLHLPANASGVVPPIAALPTTDRNVLLAELLDALVLTLQQFEQAGLAPFVARWNALHAHAGQRVDILDQGKILQSGIALGIDASGRLLLDCGSPALPQVKAIVAGDVSLRANQGAVHAVAD